MAFNNSHTAVTGATYTAAQYNTHVRDNFTAVWVYTTAGDISYASSATVLNRLAIGSAYQLLQVNAAGNAPQWGSLHKAILSKSGLQAYTTGSSANITFDQETEDTQGWHDNVTNNDRITVSVAGYYIPLVYIRFQRSTGGSGQFHMSATVQLNGSDTANGVTVYETIDLSYKRVTFGGIPVLATASQYFTVTFTQDSGATGNLTGGSTGTTFSLLRIP